MKKRSLRRAGRIHAAVVGLMLFPVACGDGPTEPRPQPAPAEVQLVVRTVAWHSWEPDVKQAGQFEYDDGRLIGHRFGFVQEDGSIAETMRQEFLYDGNGSPLGNNGYVRGDDGEWHLVRITRYSLDERGLPTEVRIEEIDETGRIVGRVVGIGYDASDRMVEVRQGPEIRTFSFDPAGNITRVRSDDIRFGVQIRTMSYGNAWNPFADFPPFHNTHVGIIAPEEHGARLSIGYENAVEGQSPAAVGVARIETNEHGYPTFREYDMRNPAFPDERMTVFTEYHYEGPGTGG
jgi:hypothetical protein